MPKILTSSTKNAREVVNPDTRWVAVITVSNKLRTVRDKLRTNSYKMHEVQLKLAKARSSKHVLCDTCSRLRVAVVWRVNKERRLLD